MRSEPFETEIYNGHVIALYYDEDAECPLDYEQKKAGGYQTPGVYFVLLDNLSTLSSYHHFNAKDSGGPGEVLRFAASEGYHVFGLYGHSSTGGYPSNFSARAAKPDWPAMLVREKLNISSAGSGADIRCDEEMPSHELDSWELDYDSRACDFHIGFVLVKYSEWAVDKCTEALALANAVCDSVEKWCNGEFCGYAVFPKGYGIDEDGNLCDVHELDLIDAEDSCWGIDDHEYALDEARSHIDHVTSRKREEKTCHTNPSTDPRTNPSPSPTIDMNAAA